MDNEIISQAARHAAHGRFSAMDEILVGLLSRRDLARADLTEIANLYFAYGFLAKAEECFCRIMVLDPYSLAAFLGIANILQSRGEHAKSAALYTRLLRNAPDNSLIRRNFLVNLEYHPDTTDTERFTHAKEWGTWAVRRAGGARSRPPMQPIVGRPMKIGYLGADFCQHTVGLFFQTVLLHHDRERFKIYVYDAGKISDWLTKKVASASIYSRVTELPDSALAEKIACDGIDVLIDLSGHTAGSRLTVFAFRPAPVLMSWLGYFATTGLPWMDSVLLDRWHALQGAERFFSESIVRLAAGRFCYAPVPWAPEISPLPMRANGYPTFGSFNNTSKYNTAVFDLWAQILTRLPSAHLILKWRTFNDSVFKTTVFEAFRRRGIDPSRIELRGPSFHVDVLREYGDIDVALDPFPFTGGLTSCEALWMGVPVITLPQSRVVSRQTHALLHQIGIPEFSARDAEEYCACAVATVGDIDRLELFRNTIREKMRSSSLMNYRLHAEELETICTEAYTTLLAVQSS